ncbi:CLUMA_CG019684, isoform A [Clunio marinus]|uniref:CLUMA_CG019684, isoform A n=1 Tax=Clunio marinus TaxID=568069 RepID=A0A1J1J5D1_9DIPT|nr:CLUMA_CG019684, isoform A [Clunio marinus]
MFREAIERRQYAAQENQGTKRGGRVENRHEIVLKECNVAFFGFEIVSEIVWKQRSLTSEKEKLAAGVPCRPCQISFCKRNPNLMTSFEATAKSMKNSTDKRKNSFVFRKKHVQAILDQEISA